MQNKDCSETMKEFYVGKSFPLSVLVYLTCKARRLESPRWGQTAVEHLGPLHPAGLLQVRPQPRY